jgi:probable rRNA maturation factor
MIKIDMINSYNNSKITQGFYEDIITVLIEEVPKLSNDKIYELSVKITNNEEIKFLNNKYRNINKETNVLSFTIEQEFEHLNHLGDIIISEEKIVEEAILQGKKFQNHLYHIFIHGVLHLLGYNHEDNEEAELMENMEAKILSIFNIKNPYKL